MNIGIWESKTGKIHLHQLWNKEKVIRAIEQILKSPSTIPRGAELFKSTLFPSVILVMRNLYPDERTSTLKKCRNFHKAVRNVLVKENIKGRITTTTYTFQLSRRYRLEIEFEAEILMVRKGICPRSNPEMQAACENLQRGGWRKPWLCCLQLSTTAPVFRTRKRKLRKTAINTSITSSSNNYKKIALKTSNMEGIIHKKNVKLPAHSSPFRDSWRFSLPHSAAEKLRTV